MEWTARRIYESVEVRGAEGGFAVTLDGRPVRTPTGHPLRLPTRALAQAIADEWAAQEETVRPPTMPLSQLAVTWIDKVTEGRAATVEAVARYAETDLLCYRAEEPDDLVDAQDAAWRPLLDWAASDLGARLTVTTGIVPVAQPEEAVAALRAAVEALDDVALTALSGAAAAAGSVVVGLALIAGRIDAAEAFAASQVDETHQAGRWGEDAEAADRRTRIRGDIEAAARFLALARET